ncbi:MAG: hypothetical protein ACJ8DL_16995, partial [Microvirga sp.]
HGIAWNVANFAIVWWLLRRSGTGANRTVADREAAKQALFARLRSQPALNLPRVRRDELYDD